MEQSKVWVVTEVVEGILSTMDVCSDKAIAVKVFKSIMSEYVSPDSTDKEKQHEYHQAMNDLHYTETDIEVLVSEQEILKKAVI